MENAVLATEIFAMIILGVILYGVCFESKQKSKKKSAFIKLVLGVFLMVFLDSLTYVPINWDRKYSMHYLLTMAVFIVPFFVFALFIRYVNIFVSTKATIKLPLFQIGEWYCCVAAVVSLYCGLKGYIFTLDDNVYESGAYYDVYMFTYGVLLIYTMVIICVNGKKLGFHDSMATLMFAVIPAFFIFFNIAYEECSFMIPSLAISMLVMHIMLQAEHENELIAHDAESFELARIDRMTGLQNRLAYIEACESLDDAEVPMGVIFCDVNGLKHANDTLGHKAGDRLLCEFANILENCFRKADIYRISGDEFVVLLPGMPQGLFTTKTKELRRRIKAYEVPIASIGRAYGNEAEVQQLIETAETKMYENKRKFHKKFPDYDRNNNQDE